MAEALRDATPRPWGITGRHFAATAAVWRYRIAMSGYPAAFVASRNSHVLAFAGGDGAAPTSTAHAAYSEIIYEQNAAAAVRVQNIKYEE